MDLIQLLKPKTSAQADFQSSLIDFPVSIAYGAAGTGKTLLALNYALHQLSCGNINKIIYCCPDNKVDFSKGGSGTLPGEFKEKSKPLLAPIYNNADIFMSPGQLDYLLDKDILEFRYIDQLRGGSWNYTAAILDEAQNVAPNIVKTFLTRIGKNSKVIVIGDQGQTDVVQLRINNGLIDAVGRLKHSNFVGITKFTKEDCVRSKVVKEILSFYED